ncbi:hypothetical protein QTP88_029906 [Uroleucon formosanum]
MLLATSAGFPDLKIGVTRLIFHVEGKTPSVSDLLKIKGSLYIPLPEQFQNKHAIINVKNKDDKCFLWAILFALHHVGKDGQRVTKYIPFENEFDNELKVIEFPVKTTDVPKFVKRTKD